MRIAPRSSVVTGWATIEVRVLSSRDAAEFQRLRLEGLRPRGERFESAAIGLYEAAGFESRGIDETFMVVDGIDQDEVRMVYVVDRERGSGSRGP